MSGETDVTVVTNSYAFFIACEAAGASDARHSLRPLFRGQGFFEQTSDALRRENAKLCLMRLLPFKLNQ
jgi:hypothetical protein